MGGDHVIQVPLPLGAEPTGEDVELLEAVFNAIVALRFQGTRDWEKAERALVANGWTVRSRLMWVAEARKGWDAEQATGLTRDEAFAGLLQLTRVDELAGVP